MTHVHPTPAPRKRRSRRRVPELIPVSLPGRPANSNRTGADIIPLGDSPKRRLREELRDATVLLGPCEEWAIADFLPPALTCLRRAWMLHAYATPEERAQLEHLQHKAERVGIYLRRRAEGQTASVVRFTGHMVEGRA